MTTTTKLPVPSIGKSSMPIMAAGSLIEAVPNVISSIGSIFESCNNRDIRMCEIQEKARLVNNKIEKDYLDKCNQWVFKDRAMQRAFESEKITGDQIVEMAKEFVK